VPRRVVALILLTSLAAVACGAATAGRPGLAAATGRTTRAGTAQYTLNVSASFSGAQIRTQSRGAISFRVHQAHVYKLVPGDPYPEEQIVDGPWTYSNANVAAALGDPRVKPWTKVDTRRLPAQQRIGELDHARALAYLSDGARKARLVGASGSLVHWRGSVDPARVLAHVPASERATMQAILRADYAKGVFPADFWLDRQNRLRRVRVSYTTAKGTGFTLDGTFSGFGTRVDVTPPPARSTRDITP
jgi:hypothetical protein